MKTRLPWTVVCDERHEKVVAIEQEARALGLRPTRRQARKAISGRGRLPAQMAELREEAKP